MATIPRPSAPSQSHPQNIHLFCYVAQVRMQLRARQYTAFAKIPPFGSIDGNVTSATPLKIGSLVCFGLKRSITPVSCDASNIGEEQLSIGLGSYISR
ncbi:BQ5605_C018g08751 [Microbotryum silenes-dioicae]|uniref:BQ5605_C018g08751 protein n=1 Tax=Microbotryum silenes-dioicae TaxID=796604 RepID=A0A2X0NUQ4_9BASI|nr:BQ5605_C018g08751 [Microbotryum silenes-dioicae]